MSVLPSLVPWPRATQRPSSLGVQHASIAPRTKNRDTLHSLIEGHGSLASTSQCEDTTGDVQTRERSNTDESQIRARRAAISSTGTMEVGSTDDGSGDRGGGAPSATTVRSAGLLRRDLGPSRDLARESGVGNTVGSAEARVTKGGGSTTSSSRTAPEAMLTVPAGVPNLDRRTPNGEAAAVPAAGAGRRLSSGSLQDHQRAARSAKAAQATLKKLEEERKRVGEVSDSQVSALAAQATLKRMEEEQQQQQQQRKGNQVDGSKAQAAKGGKVGDAAGVEERKRRLRRFPEPRFRMPSRQQAKADADAGALEAKLSPEEEEERASREAAAKANAIAAVKAEIEAKTRQQADMRTATVAAIRKRQAQADAEAAESRRRALAEVHAAETRRRAKAEAERVRAEEERARLAADLAAAGPRASLTEHDASNVQRAPGSGPSKPQQHVWRAQEYEDRGRLAKARPDKEVMERDRRGRARSLEKVKDAREKQPHQEGALHQFSAGVRDGNVLDRLSKAFSPRKPEAPVPAVSSATDSSSSSERGTPALPGGPSSIPAPVSTTPELKAPRQQPDAGSLAKLAKGVQGSVGQGARDRSSSVNDDDGTAVTVPIDKDQNLDAEAPYASVVSGETDAGPPPLHVPPPPLTQRDRDENVLRAHLASWRFCFHEAAALLTPVLGAACVESPPEDQEESGAAGLRPNGDGFLRAPSEEIDIQSEVSRPRRRRRRRLGRESRGGCFRRVGLWSGGSLGGGCWDEVGVAS